MPLVPGGALPSARAPCSPVLRAPSAVSRRLYPRHVAQRAAANLVPFERLGDDLEAPAASPIALAPVELPRAPRPGWPTLAALAVASGLAAIGLGAWAVLDQARSPEAAISDDAVAVLADSAAERYPLRRSEGRITLVVTPAGDAALALDGLGVAPPGRTYKAWLLPAGSATPVPDTAFDASQAAVTLGRRVSSGDRVGVTLEDSPAVRRPSRALRLLASRP